MPLGTKLSYRMTALLIGLAVLSSLSGCGRSSSDELSRQLGLEAKARVGRTLRIAEVTDFEWDRLYVFGPYTPPEEIRSAIGVDFPEYGQTTIENDDAISLLVFVRGQQVVAYTDFPRHKGDFVAVLKDGPFSPDTAVFRVSESANDRVPFWGPFLNFLPAMNATAP